MSTVSASEVPVSGGVLGTLRSWLRAWSGRPRPVPQDGPGGAGAPDAPRFEPIRVLVVDDNPVNLMLMSALMEPRGLVPLLAADGAEAVALACELHFDLILMDLQMPILDGWGATAAIRRFEQASARPAVPVLAYSSLPQGAADLAAHGMNGCLPKPCDAQALEDCLARWCPGYQAVPAGWAARQPFGRWRAVPLHGRAQAPVRVTFSR